MLQGTTSNLSELSSSEKLPLMEELWDDLAQRPADLPMPDWQKRELERRYQEYLAEPTAGSPWPEVRARLLHALR